MSDKHVTLKTDEGGKVVGIGQPAGHTPTPWIASPDGGIWKDSFFIGRVSPGNAEFIVRAVNAYDANQKTIAALLEAAKRAANKNGMHWKSDLHEGCADDCDGCFIEKAIAQAGGQYENQ